MIPRYRLLAARIRTELQTLERSVDQAEGALARAEQQPADQSYFVAAVAFELHSFYAGLERLFEVIGSDVEQSRPAGATWHRELLAQMALPIADVRPAVVQAETRDALLEYLEFRHVVRHMYTFDLRIDRVIELGRGLRAAFDLAHRDLLRFAEFLDRLAAADEAGM
ncbi:MAG: hypothetical protein HGB05_05590 [Chloroflexi bacterium]|nr:hypothetical protein [Chloroflexota bacterium]